jgi:hypothetical protein
MHASKSYCTLNPLSRLCCSWHWVEWTCESVISANLVYKVGIVGTVSLLCNYVRNLKTCGKNCAEQHKGCVSRSSVKSTQNTFDSVKYLSILLPQRGRVLTRKHF